ncbi:hypothetical protein Hanom_Chr17g01525851 [Helianthus anomalus]
MNNFTCKSQQLWDLYLPKPPSEFSNLPCNTQLTDQADLAWSECHRAAYTPKTQQARDPHLWRAQEP